MHNITIWEEELKQIKYMDQAIRNMKTPEQERIIEKKEKEKRLKKREEAMIKSLERIRSAKKYTFINHLTAFVEKKHITQAMIEKEQLWWEEFAF